MMLGLTFPFLNQPMLWGLAAISIPIIIHLLNKRRFKRIRWGAMQFLHASLSRVSRRMRMENLLLLLLRILIVVLIALAFARPYVSTKFTIGGLLGETKTSMVILIDTSMSMGYVRDGKTDLEHAKEAAKFLITTLKKGDSVSVFSVADKTKPLFDRNAPFLDFQRAKDKIDALKLSSQGADFQLAMDTVVRHLLTLRNPAREVFIVTDMQGVSWRLGDSARWTAIAEPLRTPGRFPRKVPFSVVDVSGGETENSAVVNLSYYPHVIVPGTEVRVECELHNFGKTTRDTAVTPVVDGIPKPNLGKPVRLEAGQSSTEGVYVRFDEPGSHQVTVEIGSDALTVDNRRHLALDVLKDVRVLIVNGAPSVQPFKGETDFLATALSPDMDSQIEGETRTLAVPEVVGLPQLNSENFSNYHVVILANVANLGAAEMDRLEKFVSDGGGLLIFPGDLVDKDFYNSLYRDGTGMLPAALVDTEGDEKDRTKYIGIVNDPPSTHPVMGLFKDPTRSDLKVGRIYKSFRLDPPAGSASVKIIAPLSNGLPFLVEKTFGRGRVVLCATRCNAPDWTDMPLHKFYVPLMHELVYYVASSNRPERNVLVGQPLVCRLQSETLKPDTGLLRLPDGTTQPLKFTQEKGEWIGRTEPVAEPGIYQIEVDTADGKVRSDYAANVPPEEFDLTPLDDKQKEELNKLVSAQVVDPKELVGLARERFGVEIWRQIAFLLLVLLFGELLMTSRRVRRQEVEQLNVPEAVLNK